MTVNFYDVMDRVDDERLVHTSHDFRIFVDDDVDPTSVYVDERERRIVIHGDTYDALADHGVALGEFLDTYCVSYARGGVKPLALSTL